MEDSSLLNTLIRARLTMAEYEGLNKKIVEEIYIQEFGKLPPKLIE